MGVDRHPPHGGVSWHGGSSSTNAGDNNFLFFNKPAHSLTHTLTHSLAYSLPYPRSQVSLGQAAIEPARSLHPFTHAVNAPYPHTLLAHPICAPSYTFTYSLTPSHLLSYPLLQVSLGQAAIEPARSFVHTFLRSSRLLDPGFPPPVERFVQVRLTVNEMVLYKHLQDVDLRARLTAPQDPRAIEVLLQQCSYVPELRGGGAGGGAGAMPYGEEIVERAEEHVQRLVKNKKKEWEKLQKDVEKFDKSYSYIMAQITATTENDGLREDARRSKLQSLAGDREEIIDKKRETVLKMEALQRSIDYVVSAEERLRNHQVILLSIHTLSIHSLA